MSGFENVNIPKWFDQDELNILDVIICNEDNTCATLFAGDNLDRVKRYNPTIRVYLLKQLDGKYNIVKEIGAFSLKSKKEALDFLSKLPVLTGIELIYNIHKLQVEVAI